MRNITELQQVIDLRNSAVSISASDIEALLQNVSGTAMAGIVMATEQALAAAHKKAGEVIYKVNFMNVQLFNNVTADVYGDAVRRSATGAAADIAAFETQSTYYEHTGCYSVVQHKGTGQLYLYCICNATDTYFVHNGVIVDRAHVAQYCTPSEAKKLYSQPTRNETYNIEHDVAVRVFKLENIVRIAAAKQVVKV